MQFYNKGRYSEALTACRSHLTWYILAHKAHTVPFQRTDPEAASSLMSIDIEALADLVDLLFRCHYHLEMGVLFPQVLQRLRDVVADPRWVHKIVYFQSLCLLLVNADEDAARAEIQKVAPSDSADAEVLGLYWHLTSRYLDFQASVALLDRVVATTASAASRLYYSVVKGIQFCLICQVDAGTAIIAEAISTYRNTDDKEKSDEGNLHLARCIDILGQLTSDPVITEEAAREYSSLLERAEALGLSREYRAELTRSLADCYSLVGVTDRAYQLFQASLDYSESQLTKLFLARAYIRAGNVVEGRELLLALDTSSFDNANLVDYALTWAALAATTLDQNDIHYAKGTLKECRAQEPLFEQYRQQWLVAIHEAQPVRRKNRLQAALAYFNRYVSMKPNLFGIGFDLNAIVDDIAKN